MTTDLTHSQMEAALDQAVAAWNVAGSRWHAAELAATYAKDAWLFGGRPGHFVGRTSIEAYFASYEGVILCGSMHLPNPLLRALSPDCVLAQGMVDFTFRLSQQADTHSTLRATLVLQREGASWLIADHHFSTVPAEPPLGSD